MASKRPLSSPEDDGEERKRPKLAPGMAAPPAATAAAATSAPPTGPKADENPDPLPDDTIKHTLEEWNSLKRLERKKARHQAWIARSRSWNGFQGVWKGIKVLGAGAYGIAGLFERVGDDDTRPKNIVVKQAGPDTLLDLMQEARMLRQVGKTGSVHFVKLLKDYYEEGGTGTEKYFDPSPWIQGDGESPKRYEQRLEVGRIYLEYCSGGDLNRYNKDNFSSYAPEEFVWRLFDCFSRALSVLQTGNEDPEADTSALPRAANADPAWRPMVHFDLKLDNIFIGAKDKDHKDPGIFKVADFGMARHPPDPITDAFRDYGKFCGAEPYKAPEQMFDDDPEPTIGLETDIWCMGACIYRIVTGNYLPLPRELITVSCDHGTHVEDYRTFGAEIFDIDLGSKTYSDTLKGLIFACLQYDPDKRPKVKRIQEITKEALGVFETTGNQGPEDPNLNQGDVFEHENTPAKVLGTPKEREFVDYQSVVSKIRPEFQDLSMGARDDGAPNPLVMEGDKSEPGKAVWRVHSWKPLFRSPKSPKK